MILIDTNVPMYLVGANEAYKRAARRLLDRAAGDRERLVTDAEVFQEILHRYVAIDRRDAIQPAFDALHAVIDDVFPIDAGIVAQAKALVLGYPTLSARDAVHVAVMREHGITRLMSFDEGFDAVPGVTRLA